MFKAYIRVQYIYTIIKTPEVAGDFESRSSIYDVHVLNLISV